MGAEPSREAVLFMGKTFPTTLHCASALQVGLTYLDEHAVAALDFGHLAQVCQLSAHFPSSSAAEPHGCWVSVQK